MAKKTQETKAFQYANNKSSVEWKPTRKELMTHKINMLRLQPIEIKDNRGIVKETRFDKIFLEELQDINKAPFDTNVLFRITIKPYIYEQKPIYKDENGFYVSPRAESKAPLFKDLDVKITELKQQLEKKGEINIQFPATIKTKVENGEEQQFFEVVYNVVKEIDILN